MKNKYDRWREDVITEFSEDFWNINEDWIWSRAGACEVWMWNLYQRKKTEKQAAAIIERAFYILKNS